MAKELQYSLHSENIDHSENTVFTLLGKGEGKWKDVMKVGNAHLI